MVTTQRRRRRSNEIKNTFLNFHILSTKYQQRSRGKGENVRKESFFHSQERQSHKEKKKKMRKISN